jgi:hypothetical protein
MRTLMICLLLTTSSLVFADEYAPSVTEGAATYDKNECIQTFTDNCINTICVNSSERDCNDTCKTQAADKCEEMGRN